MRYEKLVTRLRKRAKELPERFSKNEENIRLFLAAADAIESTSKAYQMMAEAYEAEVTNPKWIPVTERMPEEYTDVLCYYEYFRYGDYNCMFRTIDRGYYGDGRWGGEAGQGHKNKVLAWMPLPELPTEVKG